MENRYDNTVTEIDLKQLMIEILRYTKQIIICGLIFGVLLGGAKIAKNIPALLGANSGTELSEKELEEKEFYEEQLASYDARIEQTQKTLEQNLEYKDKSILLNMDAHSFYEARANYYIKTDYKVNPQSSIQDTDKAYSVLMTYDGILNDNSMYSYVRRQLSDYIEIKYLQELISVNADKDSAILNITVVSDTEKRTGEIMAAIKQFILMKQSEVAKTVSAHEMVLLNPSDNGIALNRSESDEQDAGESSVSQAIDVQERQNKHLETISSLQTKIVNLRAEREKLVKGDNVFPGRRAVLKSGIKFGILGFILGAMLFGGYAVMRFILADWIIDEEDVKRRFNIPVLSSLRNFKPGNICGRVLSAISSDAERAASPDEALRLAAANIKLILKSGERKETDRHILICSTSLKDFAEAERIFKEEMPDAEIKAAGNILSERSAILELDTASDIVLIEKKHLASNKMLANELERLSGLKKNVMGIVLM